VAVETAAEKAARDAKSRQDSYRATHVAALSTSQIETARTRALWAGLAAQKKQRANEAAAAEAEAKRLRVEAFAAEKKQRAEQAAATEAEAKKRRTEALEAKRQAEAARIAEAKPQAALGAALKKTNEVASKTAQQSPTEPTKPTRPTPPELPTQPSTVEPDARRAMLSSVPSGAAVLINGKGVGRTPLTLTWAPNTTASVWVTLAGYEPANFQVGEPQNGKMMRLELLPAGGSADGAP